MLGEGGLGSVFLAKHLQLGDFRAIKRVPKASTEYASFLREVQILKELRHPGIPILYDIEECSDYGYLIEEYIVGNSIYTLVNQLGYLEEIKAVSYGIQLCQIISYLHSYQICPILYLDLQPKNIFISDDKIKLIDFNRAMLFSEANTAGERYGTVGFAAPEQYTREYLDERTDIYAIGMILYYLCIGNQKFQTPDDAGGPAFENGDSDMQTWEGISRELRSIILTCLSEQKEERFETVEILEKKLEKLIEHSQCKENPSLTVSFVGSKAGAGTTHLVVSLLSYLYQKNISCLFDEQNLSGMVLKLARYQQIPISRPGELYIFGMAFLPHMGEQVKKQVAEYEVVLKDFGSDIGGARNTDADAVVLVSGGKSWEWADCVAAARELRQKKNFCIVWNFLDRSKTIWLPEEIKSEVQFCVPYFPDMFRKDAVRDSFLEELWAYVKRDTGGWNETKFFGKGVLSIFRRRIGHGGLWALLRKWVRHI